MHQNENPVLDDENWIGTDARAIGISEFRRGILEHPLMAKLEWTLLAGSFMAVMFWIAMNLKRSALGRHSSGPCGETRFSARVSQECGPSRRYSPSCRSDARVSARRTLCPLFIHLTHQLHFEESIFIWQSSSSAEWAIFGEVWPQRRS